MQMKNTVGEPRRLPASRAFAEFARLFRPARPLQALMTPVLVAVLMVLSSAGASAIVSAARPSLPGDALYGVKLLSESVSLRFARGSAVSERRLEIASRRLDEMARVASAVDPLKDDKLAGLSARFSEQMDAVRGELVDARIRGDEEAAILLALHLDIRTEEFQKLFKEKGFAGRQAARLALLSLDRASVAALETLVDASSARPDVLPEARLMASVEQNLRNASTRVASAESSIGGDASVSDERIALTARAKTAVEEARELFTQGDFKAAVQKIVESSELVTEAEKAPAAPAPSDSAASSDDAAPAGEVKGEAAPGEEADETPPPVDTSAM